MLVCTVGSTAGVRVRVGSVGAWGHASSHRQLKDGKGCRQGCHPGGIQGCMGLDQALVRCCMDAYRDILHRQGVADCRHGLQHDEHP